MKNEKIYLYLDDVRTPVDPTWQVVRSYDEFIAHIQLNGLENYQCISFDHDLGESAMKEYYSNAKPNGKIDYDNIKEKTGLDCARWMIDYAVQTGIYIPITYVHSANPVGSENIMNLINNYYKKVGFTERCVRVKVEHSLSYLSELSEDEKIRRIAILNGELN